MRPNLFTARYQTWIKLLPRAGNWLLTIFFFFGAVSPCSTKMFIDFRWVTVFLCLPFRSVITYKYNTSDDNRTLYFIYNKNSIFCQGDMFRPYRIILRPSKKTDPRFVYVSLHCGIRNAYNCLFENRKIHELVYVELARLPSRKFNVYKRNKPLHYICF